MRPCVQRSIVCYNRSHPQRVRRGVTRPSFERNFGKAIGRGQHLAYGIHGRRRSGGEAKVNVVASFKHYWVRGWMRLAGRGSFGRLATRLATWFAPSFFKRNSLADLNPKGYISPSAAIDHSKLRTGANVFIGDHVKIIEDFESGQIDIADRVQLHWEITLQTGQGGNITIGPRSSIHAGCRLIAYKSSIRIGADVHIGPDSAFFTYNHGVAPGELIIDQPLTSRGDIVLEDDVNLGCGVVILDGVTIGKGSLVGAGSVVIRDVPPGAIVMGVPARVIRFRHEQGVAISNPKVMK